jgi:hypothetical protein
MSEVREKPDAPPTDWRIDDAAKKPGLFVKAEWTILKATGRRVHARHIGGMERKLPKHWFD